MGPTRTQALTIRTPEGVTFSLPLASPVARGLAWALDAACVGVGSNLVTAALGLLGLVSADLARAASLLAYLVVSVGYAMALEWLWRGQTLGKRLLGLRVMDEGGLNIRFQQIAVRNLLRYVDLLPACYGLGGAACLVTRRAQRLGDLVAGTVVVRHTRIGEPELEGVLAGKYNSLRQHAYLAARLRQLATPEEAALALQATLRREELDPAARLELFGRLAAHLRGLVTFPEEATLGLTDEQLVRNAVDVIYRPRNPGSGPRRASASADPVCRGPEE